MKDSKLVNSSAVFARFLGSWPFCSFDHAMQRETRFTSSSTPYSMKAMDVADKAALYEAITCRSVTVEMNFLKRPKVVVRGRQKQDAGYLSVAWMASLLGF